MPRGNRDSWCTPKWLADALGWFNLDPCTNPRSHILASTKCSIENGGNGLVEDDGDGVFGPGSYGGYNHGLGQMETNYAGPQTRTFINPPYSRGQVARWVAHYKHTDFCFLLRWDPSTAWFKELMRETSYVWFANKRINFEPPPGIQSSSNPYPHALFFRSQPPQGLQGLGMTLTNDSIRRYPAISDFGLGSIEPIRFSRGGH